MDKDKRDLLKAFGAISTMGISMALSIFIGVLIGRWLDQKLGTAPWLFFVFLMFGIAAGFRNIYIIAGRQRNQDSGEDNSEDKRR